MQAQSTKPRPVAPITPPQPAPVESERLDLYYRVLDDLKGRISRADSTATTLLSIQAGFVGLALTVIPFAIGHEHWPQVHRHDLLDSLLTLTFWVAFLLALRSAISWFRSILNAFVMLGRALVWEHLDPPPWSAHRAIKALALGEVDELLRPRGIQRRKGEAGLPFSPDALDSAQLAQDMAKLDIAAALIADIQAKTAVVKGKEADLREGQVSFAIGLLWFALLMIGIVAAGIASL